MNISPMLSQAQGEISTVGGTMPRPVEGGLKDGVGNITPQALHLLRDQGQACRIVDVRSPAEFAGERLADSESIPLDQFSSEMIRSLGVSGKGVYLLCQGGVRAERAARLLVDAGVKGCVVVEGGLNGWKAAGLPVERGGGRMLPVMQQTQLVIGLFSAVGAALAIWKNPWFALIPLGMGAGLIFAGLSGTCGLALLLARMPWNQRGGKGSCCSAARTS